MTRLALCLLLLCAVLVVSTPRREAALLGPLVPGVLPQPLSGAPKVVDASRQDTGTAQYGVLAPAVSESGVGVPLNQAGQEARPSSPPTAGAVTPSALVAARPDQRRLTTPKLAATPTPFVDSASCLSPCYVQVPPDSGHVSQIGAVVRTGLASWMPERYGAGYLALPEGPGWRVRLCGPASCLVMVSNDAGPAKWLQRAPYGRVADVAVLVWERLCGCSRDLGLVPVEVTLIGRVK